MSFVLSQRSLSRLDGVHPDLVRVVKRALALSKQDFAVFEGLRTAERQAQLVKQGLSQTTNSKHLKQADGFGHAVDLIPWVNGAVCWDWAYFYPIAEAVRAAAKELNVKIRWGGAWCVLNETTKETQALVADYVAERRKQGKKAFNDGPHFELYG